MAEPLRHSTLGIVSFVIAAVTIVVDVVLVAVAVAMVIPSRGRGAMPPAFPVVVVLLMGTLLSNLAGAALGLAAVLQQHRKRILGALGLALNILLPAGVVVLWALGR